MKRIIAVLLTIVLAIGMLVSCNEETSDLDAFNKCYATSNPDKIVVTSTQAFDTMALEYKTTITKGKIGDLEAATMTVKGEKMRTIEDGSGEVVYGPIEEIDITKWYREDKGVSEDKGATWDEDAESFAPGRGEIALNLNPEKLSNVVIEGNKLSFIVKAENTAEVFGDLADVEYDISVEILTDGAVVTNVRMSWVVPFNGDSGVERTTVTIDTYYYYDIQKLDMVG